MRSIPDRDLLVHAVEHSPDGVVIVDGIGTIIYANPELHKMVGAADLVGRSVDDLVPPGLRSPHARYRHTYSEHPTSRPMGEGRELSLLRDDGGIVPVEISLSPFDRDGTYVIATVRDITVRQQNRLRLAAADQQLALIEERERIGRDLHDVVLQRLYGIGLGLQAIASSGGAAPARINAAVDEIDRIIAEVRTIVFTLGSASRPGRLGQEITEVVGQATRVLGFTPTVRIDGPVESVMSDEVRAEMIASMREALGNVARHAQASNAEVVISVTGDRVELSVADNGVGPPPGADPATGPVTDLGGNGLGNLRHRAQAFGGESRLDRNESGGATLHWSVPY